MTRQKNAGLSGNSAYEAELAKTESLVRDWRRDANACRDEIRQWDALKPVVHNRKRVYGRMIRRLRSSLQTVRATTRWLVPRIISLWTQLRYRWFSLRLNGFRLQIGALALLIVINRVVFWALHVIIPIAAVWLAWILGQFLWESIAQLV